MKKLIITVITALLVLLMGTYVVGEVLKNEVQKTISMHQSPEFQLELVHYQKSFLTAQAQVKVVLPMEGEKPLHFLVDADIHHYPYKASVVYHLTLLDADVAEKVDTFFQRKDWIQSHGEISLLGQITGEIKLVKGAYGNETELFNSEPATLRYHYNLIDQSTQLTLNWAGFNGKAEATLFDAKKMNVDYHFVRINDSDVVDYQYNAHIDELNVKTLETSIAMKSLDLIGESNVSEDLLTLSTHNNWKVKEYLKDDQRYIDNHLDLLLSDLNIAVLTAQHDEPKKALQELFKRGLTINLNNLDSSTPWGKVNGKLNMQIQPGLILTQVAHNPFLLIDYVNGDLTLTLPQNLSQQADVGEAIRIGTMSGVLKPDGEQLTVQSTLDRGELSINGQVIPL